MRAFFTACQLCGSMDSDVVTSVVLEDQSLCQYQETVICRSCGLV